MQKYQNSIQNRAGDAIYNALITVTTLAGAPVVVFSDNGVTPQPQTRTDDKGMFSFYAANGHYNLTVTGDHIVTYTLTDVLIDDSNTDTIVVDTFDTIATIAALKSLIGVTNNTTVSTLGYWAAGDGGAGTYRFDLADTTSADNGGTVIVANDGGRWKLVHDYTVDVAQFGACTGTDDLIYLNAALTWADAVITADTVDTITLTSNHQLYTSDTIVHPGSVGLHLNWPGGLTTAASWVGLDTDNIIEIVAISTQHILGNVDCQNVCNGVKYGGYRMQLSETSIFHGKYYQLTGTGECRISVNANQWLKSDPEFLDKANFTAYGFYLDGADTLFIDCTVALCLYPIYLASTAKAYAFLNCHFWQGTGGGPGPVPVDPIIVVNQSNSYNYMYGCYFDNGYVYMKRAGLYIQGGQYTHNALTNITEPYIRYFCAANNVSPTTALIKNIKASVGFYTDPDTGNVYPGDFTTINALSVDKSKGESMSVFRYDYNVCPNEGTTPARVHLKPIDEWVDSYQIGINDPVKMSYGVGEIGIIAPIARFTSGSGVPHKVKLGSGLVGLSQSTSNELTFSNDVQDMWYLNNGATGDILPLADASYNIGSSTARVQNTFTKQLRVSPSTTETLPHNLTIGFKWVDDTHFMFMQRGSDGVTRTVTLTTA